MNLPVQQKSESVPARRARHWSNPLEEGTGRESRLSDGLVVGFLAWLGFPASVHFVRWVFERRPAKLSGLNLAHTLVVFLVMGAILAVWA